jgi:adenine deaminase
MKHCLFLQNRISRRHILLSLVVVILLFTVPWETAGAVEKKNSYDIIIKGGKIYDGTLKPPYRDDIGIVGDKIVPVGILRGKSSRILKAEGYIVTPGFIDIHEHSDMIFFG